MHKKHTKYSRQTKSSKRTVYNSNRTYHANKQRAYSDINIVLIAWREIQMPVLKTKWFSRFIRPKNINTEAVNVVRVGELHENLSSIRAGQSANKCKKSALPPAITCVIDSVCIRWASLSISPKKIGLIGFWSAQRTRPLFCRFSPIEQPFPDRTINPKDFRVLYLSSTW